MAERDKKQPGIQPSEDYYGRESGPRHEEQEGQKRTGPQAPDEEHEQERHAHTIDPTERTPGAILDEIPDGDGPRSDAGTNPLPDVYWSAYPDRKPEEN
jgi:hypothetical protein